MTIARNLTWFKTALQTRESVLPLVLPRILFFSLFAVVVALMDRRFGLPDLSPFGAMADNVVCNLVLGLLLVFRTNTAYDRFWDGRKAWGEMVVGIRSIVRELQTGLMQLEGDDRDEQEKVLKYLSAFALCTKLTLRNQSLDSLKSHLDSSHLAKLKTANSAPLELLLWVGQYVQKMCDRGHLDSNQRYSLNCLINQLVEALTTCERIQTTPMPIAYSVYLKRLTLLYCLLIPFSLVHELHLWIGLVTALVSFVLISMEEIGNEIEDPFGLDANDLPLDDICTNITSTISTSITKRPYQVHIEKSASAL
jgi:ion channel-forming bestrophin family protein